MNTMNTDASLVDGRVDDLQAPSRDMIDVKALIRSLTQEELLAAAESYFASITDPTFHLAKPFASVDDCPTLLANFSKLLRDGRFLPGHRVLEFGAGSCWAGRLLNQLGMTVTSLDVSSSALALGKRLSREQPVFGRQPAHEFMLYDGIQIALPDNSIDRIFCFDAFHHVANTEQTLKEFARVLEDGGIASFCEPGPNHSRTCESQREMRDHKVIENDIVLEELWDASRIAGFTDIYFTLQSETSVRLGYEEFKRFRTNGFDADLSAEFLSRILEHNRNTTIFHLVRGTPSVPDSRTRKGLIGDLRIKRTEKLSGNDGARHLKITIEVHNSSDAVWLRSGTEKGCVNLGIRLLDSTGNLLQQDFGRHRFLDSELAPGETVSTTLFSRVPVSDDSPRLEIDLVSENICWFSENGSQTVCVNS